MQILCGVSSADDPAAQLVKKLQRRHPQADLRLVLCPDDAARNPKVSKLVQLEPHATHPVIVLSDADVWVEKDYLQQALATLASSLFAPLLATAASMIASLPCTVAK